MLSKGETEREIKKHFELNGNNNIAYHNVWDASKTVLREKSKALKTYISK